MHIIIVSAISVFLTGSGTGVIVFLLLLLTENDKWRRINLFLLPIFILIMLLMLSLIFVRGSDYVNISLGSRFSIIMNAFLETGLFPSVIGSGTNLAILLGNNVIGGIFADSMPASIILNMGKIGIILFIPIIFNLILKLISKKTPKVLFQTILVGILFSFTTIITEAYALFYPLSILFYLGLPEKQTSVDCI